ARIVSKEVSVWDSPAGRGAAPSSPAPTRISRSARQGPTAKGTTSSQDRQLRIISSAEGMSESPDTELGEVIVEFVRNGSYLKCSAVHDATGTEASAVGPVNERAGLERIAVAKL